ncbi:MAG: DNA repair protein RecO [bacterium]|nr:DNA repair protein RecO [bacterium]
MWRNDHIEGFVLKKKSLLGKDQMVVLFTKEYGKIRALAKGVKTFKSKRSAHLQTGNLIKAILSSRHSVNYIQSTDLISGFIGLRTDTHTDALYLLIATLDGLLPEDQQETLVYRIFTKALVNLSKPGAQVASVLTDSLNKLLHAFGYSDEEYSLHEALQKIEEYTERALPKPAIGLARML